LFLGPAFVAAVAYVDPGNFATNIQAGSETGYQLVWVVIAANLAAIMIQTQSAKLGLVSGRSLPELIRDRARPPVVIAAWLGAEVVAMATDLAELVGAGLGLNLLTGRRRCREVAHRGCERGGRQPRRDGDHRVDQSRCTAFEVRPRGVLACASRPG
jgi:Natural resistance-associated macrophage protein